MTIHPELVARGSFEHMKLGRKPYRPDPRALKLVKYLDPTVLPAIPPACDYGAAVPLWPMYGNDRLGDCTVAAAGHLIQAWSAAEHAERTPADADVEATYWLTGDPPAESGTAGGATDDGRDEWGVLNYWRKTGIGGDKIVAYVAVDPSNIAHVQAAIYLFGSVYTGIALPKSAQSQPVWDVVGDPNDESSPAAAGSWGGHAVPYVAYDTSNFTCVTWGSTLKLTHQFSAIYCEEAYAIVSDDFLKDGKSPQGFDLDALHADLAYLEGQNA